MKKQANKKSKSSTSRSKPTKGNAGPRPKTNKGTARKIIKKKSSPKSKAKGSGPTSHDILEKILIAMRQKPYSKILTQFEMGKKRLSEERKMALELGLRVLSKAREVRDSIMNPTKLNRR